jgi:dihydrodipicolinate synthase/N-acetylneuraminate lyase
MENTLGTGRSEQQAQDAPKESDSDPGRRSQKLHPSLEAGAVGAILAFACPAPTACYEIYAAWKEDDKNLANLKQERILQPAQRVAAGLSVSGLKYAMDFNGYYGGPPRLPLLPLTAELRAEVERLMADIRN